MLYTKRIKLGFSFLKGRGGPTTFMRRLRESIQLQGFADTTTFINPLTDINIYSNAIRNPWCRPYVLRVDGISYDLAVSPVANAQRNKPIFDGIDAATGVIFQAQFSLNLITKFRKRPDCLFTIIPNGVDLTRFTPLGPNHREALGIPKDALVFISSAKWRAHKRLDAVIRAFARFQEVSGKVAHLLVMGSLDNPPDGIPERVHLIGHVPSEDLPTWYRSADLCLYLSWLDNCPNTVVEALACRLPVICSNQGGTRELVEMTGGGIVVEADMPFNFEPVELYRPPQPDPDTVLRGILEACERRHALSAGIDRNTIDIDSVARKYVAFLELSRNHRLMSKNV